MRIIALIIIMLALNNSIVASPPPRPRKYVCYAEKVKSSDSSFQNHGLPLKTKRLSTNESNIVLCYDSPPDDSIRTALEAAKGLWESKLPINQPVYIIIAFEPLEGDIAMESHVSYCERSNFEGYPTALVSQINGAIDVSDETSPDGVILFNSDIEWNCRFSIEETSGDISGYNLTTMALRGITRCLGFGSSITKDGDSYYFYHGFPTFFDNMLYHEDIRLSSIATTSTDFKKYITSDKVYAHTKTHSYKIYTQDVFVNQLSLCYFDDRNSLMSYSLGDGDVYLSIDDKTTDILRSVGWDMNSSGHGIVCEDISDDGIGSAYSAHTFSLAENPGSISEYRWSFFLKDHDGIYVRVSGGTDVKFTIPKINAPDNYHKNINGDLEGKIECVYKMDGNQYSSAPFKVSLELKPAILSIDNIDVINADPHVFSLLFNVHYAGADHLYIEIEEDYNTTLRNYRFDEPYIAHIKTGNISKHYKSWITVIVSNKYGSAYRTLEYDPILGLEIPYGISTSSISTLDNDRLPTTIQLYNIEGMNVFNSTPSDFINRSFIPGLYIKKEIFENEQSRIYKIRL